MDARLTIDGKIYTALAGWASLPSERAWLAEVEVSDAAGPPPVALKRPAVLTLDTVQLRGFVVHSTPDTAVQRVVVTGVPALEDPASPAQFRPGSTTRNVLTRILPSGVVSRVLGATPTVDGFIVTADPAGQVLEGLAKQLGCRWWVEFDGSITLGTATLTEPKTTAKTQNANARGRRELSVVTLDVLPRTKFEGVEVRHVLYEWNAKDGLVGTVWLADGFVGPGGILRDLVANVVEAEVGLPNLTLARVVRATANGRVDVRPDSRSGLPPLDDVRLLAPFPGQLTPRNGDQVLVGFERGLRSQPLALPQFVQQSGSKALALVDDGVQVDLYMLIAPVGQSGAPVVVGISPTLIAPVPPVTTVTKVTLSGKIVGPGYVVMKVTP